MVGREKTFGDIGSQTGDGGGRIARRIASGKSPKEKALLAAKLAVAMLLAQLAFAAYAGAGEAPPPCPDCPPAPTAPVAKTKPADGATGVDRDAHIRVKFFEKMNKATIKRSTVYLMEEDSSERIPAEVRYSQKKKKATLDPKERLEANTEYVATVEGNFDGDERQVETRDGSPALYIDYEWSFTTGRK